MHSATCTREADDELRQRHTTGIDNSHIKIKSLDSTLKSADDDDQDGNDRALGVSSSDESVNSVSREAVRRKRHRHNRQSRTTAEEKRQCIDDNNTTRRLENSLTRLSPRWRNWVIRGIFGILMIIGGAGIVFTGPLALMTVTVLLHIFCFKEIIDIGYAVYRTRRLPWFRTLSWYFLFSSSFFIYGSSFISGMAAYFRRMHRTGTILSLLVTYHHFISFCLYTIGFVVFVLTLRKGYYFRQFSLFAWTHMVLFILDIAAYSLIANIFEGIVWWVTPVMMIVTNDIMAYIFGFFFGKTPLIRLSPKKTWEGFIGGAVSTVTFGTLLSFILLRYPYFICPIEFDERSRWLFVVTQCEPSLTFQLARYKVADISFVCYPFLIHAFALSLFSSIIGPFGGFCASGFKRAVRVKDFGAVIPGHGGWMDRFDCQVLMAIFVHVYIKTFIRQSSPERIMHQVAAMDNGDQLMVYELLGKMLSEQGLLNYTASAVRAVARNLTILS